MSEDRRDLSGLPPADAEYMPMIDPFGTLVNTPGARTVYSGGVGVTFSGAPTTQHVDEDGRPWAILEDGTMVPYVADEVREWPLVKEDVARLEDAIKRGKNRLAFLCARVILLKMELLAAERNKRGQDWLQEIREARTTLDAIDEEIDREEARALFKVIADAAVKGRSKGGRRIMALPLSMQAGGGKEETWSSDSQGPERG